MARVPTRPFAVVLLATALSLPGSMALAQDAAPPPAKVRFEPAAQRLMAPTLQVPGSVMSLQDADIAAEVSGRVTWVAEAGTRVNAGDAIARIDDRLLQLELRQFDAQIKSLQSQLDFQEREVERQRQLSERGSTPVTRFEETSSRRDVLAQDLVRARVSRERTALEIERASVKAPFAGQVASRMLEVGEYSAPGARVARLVAVDQVEVRAQAPVAIARFLSDGMDVLLDVEGQTTHGTISRIISIGEAQSRTFEVRVKLPRTDQPWIVGGAVQVGLPSAAAEKVVAIHRDALVIRGTGTHVFRINAQNKAERVEVRTGTAMGDWIQVIGEVNPGDRLITRGAERLREGQGVEMDPKVS